MLKDSIVSDHIVPSLETRGKTYYNLRNKLEADGVISERKFVRNYEFSAPSAASAVILGHTSNGNMDWKTAGGVETERSVKRIRTVKKNNRKRSGDRRK